MQQFKYSAMLSLLRGKVKSSLAVCFLLTAFKIIRRDYILKDDILPMGEGPKTQNGKIDYILILVGTD